MQRLCTGSRLQRCLFITAFWIATYPLFHYVHLFLSNNNSSSQAPQLQIGGNGSPFSHNHTATRHARTGDTLDAADPRWAALSLLPPDSSRRVAFVTFSFVPSADDPGRLVRHLLGAVDTWAAPEVDEEDEHPPQQLYVVLTFASRGPFEAFCGNATSHTTSTSTRNAGTSVDRDVLRRASELCPRLRPIYVDCPEGKAGESPCCKQQQGLAAIVAGSEYPLFDWYAFFDDDTYLRKEYIAGLLATFESADFPMAFVGRGAEPMPLGKTGYLRLPVKKRCSHNENYMYPWGQPIFYSRAAVLLMAKGYRAGSLVKQCLAYDVTHDVGNAILNWMYSLPVRTLPSSEKLPNFRDDFIGSHWAGRQGGIFDDMFGKPKAKTVYKSTKETMSSFSFQEVHEKWKAYPQPETSLIAGSPHQIYWYKNVTGFFNTATFEKFGEPHSWEEGVWHTSGESDCRPRSDELR